MENPAVVFPEPGVVEIESELMPELGLGEVLIKTQCSLISTGTELTVLTADYPEGSAWAELVQFPARPGYSNVGEVVQVSPDVDPALVGRRVASFNRHALYVKGDTTAGGSNALRWLPDDGVSSEAAAFFTLAEVAMNGIRRSGLHWGESVVVYGLGVIGQIAARLCTIAGARPVIGVDLAPARLATLPADKPWLIALDATSSDVMARVAELTEGRMADVVLEVTGAPDLIPQELDLLREQGRLVLIGASRGAGTFINFHDVCTRWSRTIVGAHYFSHPQNDDPGLPWTPLRHARLFFQLIASGELDLASMVTHRFPHERAADAYELLRTRRDEAMGVLLEWQ